MSRTEVAFLIALAITAVCSVAIVFLLRDVLRRLLEDLCGSRDRALFWTRFTNVLVVLVPLLAVMLGRTLERNTETLLFQVVDLFKWSLLGLVITLGFVAAAVSSFIRSAGGFVRMSPEQLDGLQRLLSRVEEIRARELVNRADAEKSP